MTTQNITATVGNGNQSKIFTLSATDGKWDANNLTDSVSSSNLGLVMPGVTIDRVCVQYTGGSCIWRIQSSSTLVVKRAGMASQTAIGSDQDACMIAPYKIENDDIISVYPLATTAAATTTVMAWVMTDNAIEPFGATVTDASGLTEITSLLTSQSLGDVFFGQNVRGVWVQCEDDKVLTSLNVTDATGGVQWTGYGAARVTSSTGSGTSRLYNAYFNALNIPLSKGFVLKADTSA